MIRTVAQKFTQHVDVKSVLQKNLFTSRLLKDENIEQLSKAKKSESPKPESTILVQKDENITLIGINRPSKLNAVNGKTAELLCEAFTNFENDDSSPVAVLYGVGSSFCSGYDLMELATEGDQISTDILMTAEGSVGPTRRHIRKPVICGINGYCVANGLELALMCDMRIMEETAVLGFFNRRLGVPLIDGGTARLPALIGLSRALDLILTGRQLEAKEAMSIGIVNKLVATGTSLCEAKKLAFFIAKFPQAALNHDRNSMYSAVFEALNFNAAVQNEIMLTSKDMIEEMKVGIQEFIKSHAKGGTSLPKKDENVPSWKQEEMDCQTALNNIRNETKKKT